MTRNTKQTNTKENILYNNILLLSRNKVLFTKFNLIDSFQNRMCDTAVAMKRAKKNA